MGKIALTLHKIIQEHSISQRNMESSIKDKYIILGFVGFAIVLISSIATLVIADSFNQDNFVRWIVFVCCNLLGWLLYLSFQTLIFDTYEIYKIKFGKKETIAEAIEVQEELSQNTLESGDKMLQKHTYHGQDIEEEEKLAESFEQCWNRTGKNKGFKLWNNFWKQKRSALPVLKAMLIDYYIEEMNKAVECTKKGDEKIHDNSTAIIGDIYFKIFKEEIYDEPSVNECIKDWKNRWNELNKS